MLTKLALKAETFFARFRRHKSSLQIVPYIGYASQHKAFVHGRVLRNKPLPRITEHDTIWHNLANTYRRFDTDEVPNVSVHITLEDQTVTIRERDSLKQDRIHISKIREVVEEGISFAALFQG